MCDHSTVIVIEIEASQSISNKIDPRLGMESHDFGTPYSLAYLIFDGLEVLFIGKSKHPFGYLVDGWLSAYWLYL